MASRNAKVVPSSQHEFNDFFNTQNDNLIIHIFFLFARYLWQNEEDYNFSALGIFRSDSVESFVFFS